jgi:hypothetical protein
LPLFLGQGNTGPLDHNTDGSTDVSIRIKAGE